MKLTPDIAKALLVQLAASGADSPEARRFALELQKIALSPGSKAQPIEPGMFPGLFNQGKQTGVIDRFKTAMRYLLLGVTPETWMSPAQPLAPIADKPGEGTIGRRLDFPVGVNLNYTPRSEGVPGGVPFWVLRNLADSYDLLRLVIETRKDQIAAFSWEIAPKDEKKKADDFKDQVKKATEFFERPSPEHDWLEFLRAVVEDDLVCGNVALYPRLNRGGELHSLMPVDVTTIKKVVDEFGYQPMPPNPAFQGILKGLPAVDYMTCDTLPEIGDPLPSLVYWSRNPRTWKLYGYGPVEQVIVTTNIALRRQQFQMEYYTEGSIPDMIIGLPEATTPDQIKEFQTWWDSVLSGQTAVRRKVRFVPEIKGQITPKEAAVVLVDTADEWFARIICYCFSVAPTALIKQTNRAQSQQVAETAKEEGLLPFLNWLAWKLTWVTNNLLHCPDVKFSWNLAKEVDPKVASDIRLAEVAKGLLTINEAREDTGRPPVPGGEKPLIITATEVIPLKEGVDRATEDLVNPPPPPPVMGAGPNAPKGGQPAAEPKGEEKKGEKFELHVHGAPVTVNAPDVNVAAPQVNLPAIKVEGPTIHQGDTHTHVAPAAAPDVFVNVEGSDTHIKVDGGKSGAHKITRQADGSLVSEPLEKKAA